MDTRGRTDMDTSTNLDAGADLHANNCANEDPSTDSDRRAYRDSNNRAYSHRYRDAVANTNADSHSATDTDIDSHAFAYQYTVADTGAPSVRYCQNDRVGTRQRRRDLYKPGLRNRLDVPS